MPADPVYIERPESSGARALHLANIVFTAIVGPLAGVVLIAFVAYQIISATLPQLDTLSDYRPNLVTRVFDVKGRLMGEFRYENQRRFLVPVSEVPQTMIDAFVAVEDEHFFTHEGLDYAGIARAAWENLRRGQTTQGASTITMQVCRSLLLTRERTYTRKLKEAILAWRLERRFTKEEILYLYLNEIYFGHGAYGVAAAADTYFGKAPADLTLGEAALIAGLPQAPSRYDPFRRMDSALARRKHVLSRMAETGKIDRAAAEAAAAEDLALVDDADPNREVAPWFTEHVRRYVMKKYGAEPVLKDGWDIHTTCDLDLQDAAVAALRAGLHEISDRQGYRPEKRVAKSDFEAFDAALARGRGDRPIADGRRFRALVVSSGDSAADVRIGGDTLTVQKTGIAWIKTVARRNEAIRKGPFANVAHVLREGDVTYVRVTDAAHRVGEVDRAPAAQAALVAMDPATREVAALVGGYSFDDSEFNRALQAHRQPGSSFKPIVYAAALDAGMTPATRIMDTALVFADGWRPRNYSGSFSGELTLREALTKSINTVTVRTAQAIGPGYIERYARRLGLASLAGSDLSMALGSYEVIPIELINAYAVFASGGLYSEPIFVRRIVGRDGEPIEENVLGDAVRDAEPLANVPDVRVADLAEPEELAEGAPALAYAGDNPAQKAFLDDFGIDIRIKGLVEKPHPRPPDLTDVPLPRYERGDDGRIVARRVIGRDTAFLLTSMLNSAASRGTGARSNALSRTLAGKTGTTNNNVDAWFIGFSPRHLAGVWVGHDAGAKSLGPGETGSKAALPIWIAYMKTALADAPNEPFAVPGGVVSARIDPATGLLAWEGQPDAVTEYFAADTVPEQMAPSPDEPDPEKFFEMDF
ncbi:transglycosylase domain-containing protein [bacterium]|nr:transglycosylase domain-containing protein [bacterium]